MELSREEMDQAFTCLEELLAAFELMQEKDKRLAKAREARELLALKSRADVLEEEVQRYQQIVNRATADAKEAAEKGNKEAERHALAELRMYSELCALRFAPEQRAKKALELALEQGTLSLDGQLEELAMSDEEYRLLEEEILDYRAEYLACYELCRSFDFAE